MSADSSSQNQELQCFEFNFDASTKKLTSSIMEAEEKRQHRLFSSKVKVPISQVTQMLADSTTDMNLLAQGIQICASFYRQQKDGEKFIEVLARWIIDAASKEVSNVSRQLFLLYTAIDVASTSVQTATRKVYPPGCSLMVSTFKVLTPINNTPYHVEKKVHSLMSEMLVNKDLVALESRERIIKFYMQGRRHYEAFYHLNEYEQIMLVQSRAMFLLKSGEIQIYKAKVFQDIIDFYLAVVSGKSQKQQVKDMGKLRSFITRFNQDFPKSKIVLPSGKNPISINKMLSSMIQISNHYYQEAANNKRFSKAYKAYYSMAQNSMSLDQHKQALKYVEDGIKALGRGNIQKIDAASGKVQLMELAIELHKVAGTSAQAEKYKLALKGAREESIKLHQKKKEKEAKMKELAEEKKSTSPAKKS